ncbi:MAG: protein kinase [Deltaproteobacteria bacterium]|nr:protein kinase [Deltaproteobacteria bacterium]
MRAVEGGQPGEFGPYTLLGRIAVGGMAEVYRALAPRTGADARTVVIKRMLPHIAAEAEGLEMFEKEAQIGGRVRHPNVVELLGAGEVEDAPYLVLEYVPGCDLWRLMRWLRREGRSLGVEPALLVLRDLLLGLQAVHDTESKDGAPLAIVHRDVSPSNVLLSVHGDVKLGDFGIARALLVEERPQVSNQAKGKLGYLSPEQVMGKPMDQRADIFAAGVVGAELLMGRELFAGGSELAILLAIRDANISPFTRLAIDPDLKAAVCDALARKPDERIPTAAAFAERISAHIQSPEPAIRREIAELVRVASGGKDDPELQRTPEIRHWAAEAPPTPVASDIAPAVLEADAMRPSFPETAEVLEHTYFVETADGQIRGTFRFAELAQALTTGELGPTDLVSVDGGKPQPIRTHPALNRHLPMATLTPITMDQRLAQEPDIRRNFSGGGFVRGLAETAVANETGLWLCEQGGSRKEVYVAGGVPEFVGSNIAGEMLGEYLVARGVLSRGQLDTALGLLPRYDGRLGDTLVSLRYVEPVELFQHIATQVEEKILDLFAWTSGEASFYRGVPPPPSRFPLGLDVWALLDRGLAHRMAEGLEEERFRTHLLDSLEPTPQRPAFAASGNLPPILADLMEAVPAAVPLQEVVATLEGPDDATRGYRAVLLGLQLQLVRWQAQ